MKPCSESLLTVPLGKSVTAYRGKGSSLKYSHWPRVPPFALQFGFSYTFVCNHVSSSSLVKFRTARVVMNGLPVPSTRTHYPFHIANWRSKKVHCFRDRSRRIKGLNSSLDPTLINCTVTRVNKNKNKNTTRMVFWLGNVNLLSMSPGVEDK